MPANKLTFQESRLLAAGTGDNSYYWINLELKPEQYRNSYEFRFILYLEDEFERRWVSEHGGRLIKVQTEKNGVKTDGLEFHVWSYKMYKKKWPVQLKTEVLANEGEK